MSIKKPTPEQVTENKRRQQILNRYGYNVRIDGSWGPWQQNLWDKISTKEKHYPTTPMGLIKYTYDKYLGNGTTYKQDPEYVGEIKADNRSNAGRWIDQQVSNPTSPVGYMYHTVLPAAATAGVIYGATSLPVTAAPKAVGDAVGGASRVVPQVTRHLMTNIAPKAAVVQTTGGQSVAVPIVTRFPWQGIAQGLAASGLLLSSVATPSEETSSTEGTTATSSTPDPDNENENKKKRLKDLIWERSGKPSNTNPNIGRYIRNYGIRVPLYTGVAAPIADIALNVAAASSEPDSVQHKFIFPLTKGRFALERGLYKLATDMYRTDESKNKDSSTEQSQERDNASETNSNGTYIVIPRTAPVYTQQQRDSVERLNNQRFQTLK